MRYDEVVKLSWRTDVDDEFETAEVWATIQDSGTASFDVGSGLSRADAYSVTNALPQHAACHAGPSCTT